MAGSTGSGSIWDDATDSKYFYMEDTTGNNPLSFSNMENTKEIIP